MNGKTPTHETQKIECNDQAGSLGLFGAHSPLDWIGSEIQKPKAYTWMPKANFTAAESEVPPEQDNLPWALLGPIWGGGMGREQNKLRPFWKHIVKKLKKKYAAVLQLWRIAE